MVYYRQLRKANKKRKGDRKMLEKVLGYFEQGWEVLAVDVWGSDVCEDAEDIQDAMYEDDYIYVSVEVLEDSRQVVLHIHNDE